MSSFTKIFNFLLVSILALIITMYLLIVFNTQIGKKISTYLIGGPINCKEYKDLPINEAPEVCIKELLQGIKP
jgi:hypothetical protein